ncbi:MAG: hypothetical protein KF685_13210 [Acidobacteria bacterium]|nr:hypothetical protein [Acidobacteriota bacterium]
MEPTQLTDTQAIIAIGANAAIGFFLGLVPLGFGYFKGKLRVGVIGIVVATLGGAILGVIISIPSVAIATWMIMRDSHVLHSTVEPETEEEKPSSEDSTA